MENWKDLKDYEDRYLISDSGNIISKKYKGKYLKPYINNNGYKSVTITNGIKYKNCRIHKLVALTFIPNPENKPWINHKDGNKLNNHVSNLEWCTPKENVIHALQTGLSIKHGIYSGTAVLTDEKVIEIHNFLKNKIHSIEELSIIYNTSITNIRSIAKVESWKHLRLEPIKLKHGGKNMYNKNQDYLINQYDLNNNYIKSWLGVTEIENTLGFKKQNISACLNNRIEKAYNFIWKKETAKDSLQSLIQANGLDINKNWLILKLL